MVWLGFSRLSTAATARWPWRQAWRRAHPWISKGAALYVLGRYKDAITCLEHARPLRLATLARATISTYEGLIAIRLERYDEAGAAIERALEVDAVEPDAWRAMGELRLAQGRHEDALAALDRALSVDPALETAWRARAAGLRALGRDDEAAAAEGRAAALEAELAEAARAILPRFKPPASDPPAEPS
jgi:tetratricopeptide (TPR) repeat protein